MKNEKKFRVEYNILNLNIKNRIVIGKVSCIFRIKKSFVVKSEQSIKLS